MDLVLQIADSCRQTLEDVRSTLAAGRSCSSPLHSLSGRSAVVGASRLALYAAECEARGEAFGVSDLTKLEVLLAEALGDLSASD